MDGAKNETIKDVSLNSLEYNRIINQKKTIEKHRNGCEQLDPDVLAGNSVNKVKFMQRRGSQTELRMGENGKRVYEKMLYASKDEQEYFNNKKIYSKDVEGSISPSKYKRQIPDYFRMLDDPKNQVRIQDSKNFDGMISVVSKNQGWITLSQDNPSRKRPLEKGGVSADATATSILTPTWM